MKPKSTKKCSAPIRSTKKEQVNKSQKDTWTLGTIIETGSRTQTHECPINSLRNHALICGNTGSGKTNTCFNLLEQLNKQNIPFLVIEPAKSEYRALFLQSPQFKTDARVYTLGDDSFSSLKINPLEIGKGVSVQAHIDALLSIFDASFEMYSPMPQVLTKALCSLYESRGWDLGQNKNLRLPSGVSPGSPDCPPGSIPTLKDLFESIDPVTESFGYSERIGPDVNAALKARIGNLMIGAKGLTFSNRSTNIAKTLFDGPCVLELSDKFNSCEKSFLIGVLMLFLYEHRKTMGPSPKLEHVLLIEDAHRMLKRESRSSRTASGLAAPLVSEIFVNLLSESGAYGQAIVLSSQTPASLMPEILSNTNLRIAHRLLTQEDLDAIAPSSYLSSAQGRRIVSLDIGQCMIFDKGMTKLNKVQVDSNKFLASRGTIGLPKPEKLLKQSSTLPAEKQARSLFEIDSSENFDEFEQSRALMEMSERVARDANFRTVFNRFIMSSVFDLTQVVHFRSQIIQEIQRILGRQAEGDLVSITWCVLVLSSERYFERKGEEHFWSFQELEEQHKSWLKIMRKGFTPIEDKSIDIDVLRKWRNQLINAQTRQQGPHLSCGACQAKCRFRFEVSEIVRDPKVKFDFNSAINRNDSSAAESAGHFCQLLCERLIGSFDIDLAYCLAVHFIKEQALSSDAQLVLLEKIRSLLKEEEALSKEDCHP